MNKGGFSWKTFLGITRLKRNISRTTGIPMTKGGMERKVGRMVLDILFGNSILDKGISGSIRDKRMD